MSVCLLTDESLTDDVTNSSSGAGRTRPRLPARRARDPASDAATTAQRGSSARYGAAFSGVAPASWNATRRKRAMRV